MPLQRVQNWFPGKPGGPKRFDFWIDRGETRLLRLQARDPELGRILASDARIFFPMLYESRRLSQLQLERGIQKVLDSVNLPGSSSYLLIFDNLKGSGTRHYVYKVREANDPFLPSFSNLSWPEIEENFKIISDLFSEGPLGAALRVAVAKETKGKPSFGRDELPARLEELGHIESGLWRLRQKQDEEEEEGGDFEELSELKQKYGQDVVRLQQQQRLLRRAYDPTWDSWERHKLELEREGSWIEPHHERHQPWDVAEFTSDTLHRRVREIAEWFDARTQGQTPPLVVAVLIAAALGPKGRFVSLADGLETWMRLVTEIHRIDSEARKVASWLGDAAFVHKVAQLLSSHAGEETDNFIVSGTFGISASDEGLGTFIMAAAQLTQRVNIRFDDDDHLILILRNEGSYVDTGTYVWDTDIPTVISKATEASSLESGAISAFPVVAELTFLYASNGTPRDQLRPIQARAVDSQPRSQRCSDC